MIELPTVTLAAGEIKELNLQPLLTAAANRNDLDAVSVQIVNNGNAGSLIGALYSTNQTTGVFYDVPLRDSGVVRNSTGAYPVIDIFPNEYLSREKPQTHCDYRTKKPTTYSSIIFQN